MFEILNFLGAKARHVVKQQQQQRIHGGISVPS